nr:PREDICTED: actin cytoskeleton-regulatory complex protein pan1-like [Paralichthys olivaceus]
MGMKRLSGLMLRKWKERERWIGRRRSEPCGAEEKDKEERQTDRTDRLMLRRKSEPCGQTEDFQKMEEKTSERMRKKERRKSESNMDEEDRKDRKKTEMGRGKGRRKSASWIMAEDREGGQMDRRQKEADRGTLRRRSEPCSILYIQLLPLSGRKRRELLQRRTGRRTSSSADREGQMMAGTSEPIRPLDNTHSLCFPPPPAPPPLHQEEVSVFHLETYLTEPRRPETRRLRSFSSPPDTGQRFSSTSSSCCRQLDPPLAPPLPVRRLRQC